MLSIVTETIEEIASIAEFVSGKVRRVRWTNEEIDRKFARRCAEEILSEAETFYMNPCLDLTLTTIHSLNVKGFHTQLVMQAVRVKNIQRTMPHFAIQILENDAFLDFNIFNSIILGRGQYSNIRSGITIVSERTYNGSYVSAQKNLLDILGVKSFEEVSGMLGDYSFSEHVLNLKKSNSREKYERYLRLVGEAYKILRV